MDTVLDNSHSYKPPLDAVLRALFALEHLAKSLTPATAAEHFRLVLRAAHACGVHPRTAPTYLDLSVRQFNIWRHGNEFPVPDRMAKVAEWLRKELALGYQKELLA